jgi:hypothetical protein
MWGSIPDGERVNPYTNLPPDRDDSSMTSTSAEGEAGMGSSLVGAQALKGSSIEKRIGASQGQDFPNEDILVLIESLLLQYRVLARIVYQRWLLTKRRPRFSWGRLFRIYESRGPASPALYKRRRKRGFILSLSYLRWLYTAGRVPYAYPTRKTF